MTGVYLAGVLLPCLVTALTIAREQSVRFAVGLMVRQAIADCRDPKDNKFLEVAVNGNADYIVTGDRDLLVLNPFRDIPIVSPANSS